jgi:hypothetical protein
MTRLAIPIGIKNSRYLMGQLIRAKRKNAFKLPPPVIPNK